MQTVCFCQLAAYGLLMAVASKHRKMEAAGVGIGCHGHGLAQYSDAEHATEVTSQGMAGPAALAMAAGTSHVGINVHMM